MKKVLLLILILLIVVPIGIYTFKENMNLVSSSIVMNLKVKFVDYGPCSGRRMSPCYVNVVDMEGKNYNTNLELNEEVNKLHVDKVLLLEVNRLTFEDGKIVDCVKVMGYEATGEILYKSTLDYKTSSSFIGCQILHEGTIHGTI